MEILRAIEKAKKERSKKKKEEIGLELYKTNRFFREYAKACYSMEPLITKLPKGRYAPEKPGRAPSSLEMVQTRFVQAAYNLPGSERRDHLLLLVVENISDLEVEFLRHVLKQKIPFFSKELWEANANV